MSGHRCEEPGRAVLLTELWAFGRDEHAKNTGHGQGDNQGQMAERLGSRAINQKVVCSIPGCAK